MAVASKSCQRQGADVILPWSLPKEHSPSNTLALVPEDSCWISDLENLEENECALFEATKPVVICYRNSMKYMSSFLKIHPKLPAPGGGTSLSLLHRLPPCPTEHLLQATPHSLTLPPKAWIAAGSRAFAHATASDRSPVHPPLHWEDLCSSGTPQV